MGFVMHSDARKFFERIGIRKRPGSKSTTGKFTTYFDAYWLSAQIGMVNDSFEAPDGSAPEMTRKIVGDSAEFRSLIYGVGFYYYCKNKAMVNSDDDLLKEMSKFFSEDHQALNDDGYALFNGYAHGGFNLIYNLLGDHCYELSEFLVECYDLLGE